MRRAMRRTGWSHPSPCASLRHAGERRHCRGPLTGTQAEHDMTNMHQMRARVPCVPRACPRCARSSGHRSGCPRCARLCARAVCTVCSCSLSSTCHGWRQTSCTPFAHILCDPACPHPVSACAMCWRYACSRCARLCFPRSRCVCLLRVPLLCVPVLCAFVLGVWCACAAFAYIVRRSSASLTPHPSSTPAT